MVKQLHSKMTTKGQVTIPAEVRRLLGLAPREKVAFVVDGKVVRIMRSRSVVARTAGACKSEGQPRTAEGLRESAEHSIAEEATERAGK